VGGSLAGQIPYGVATFGSYEIYKEYLEANYPAMQLWLRSFLAAVAGDMTGSMLLCPSEVVKQQVQGGIFADMSSAVKGILATDGPFGFYRGYGAQVGAR
jgi:solute carrier family 25 S-adenosylmethionine transporter 26